jgi:SAM-dependent methyltransferase
MSRLREGHALDDSLRPHAYRTIRSANFARVLEVISRCRDLTGCSLLDVGCAHGWFLELAEKQGLRALGIEPEKAVADCGLKEGLAIRVGYFPLCLTKEERFDIIVFNDVLEHIPGTDKIIEACHRHLAPGGTLAINIPTSEGVFFRLANLFARFGFDGPLERMWQKNFRSPHVAYYNDDNLKAVVCKQGFRRRHSETLQTVTLDGLWQRIVIDRESSLLRNAIQYLALLVSYPVLRYLPSDILLQIYERE